MKTEKIGILTVHKNTNFGANLQAFASCEYINSLGYDCSVVDYIKKEHDKQNHLFSWLKLSWDREENKNLKRKIKLFIALALSVNWKNKRLKRFKKFRNQNLKLSKTCYSSLDIENLNYNTLVVGSDQIWNTTITEGVDQVFYAKINGVKKRISYAASMGKIEHTDIEKEQIANLIKQLDYCSVREAEVVDYVKEISGITPNCVCDPVFLLDKTDYDKVCCKRLNKKPYLFLYEIVSDNNLKTLAYNYAKLHDLDVLDDKKLKAFGPMEFLSTLKYADVVFTNSFHGTAFSIIYNKNFYVVNNKNGGSRITNLLKKADLLERLIEKDVDFNNFSTINYKIVEENLKDYVENSKNFLKNALYSKKQRVSTNGCTGCGACVEVCGKNAIKLIKDNEHFSFAYIDSSKCVNCNLCKKVCPELNECDKNAKSNLIYAFKTLDDIRRKSTSGGAFTALAEQILSKGGVVYGASIDEVFEVKHLAVTDESQLDKVRGVKYLQSEIFSCYQSLKDNLIQGKYVLFTGTPCQIAGIKNYVKIKNLPEDKLYLVDIICHGVPSSRIFKDFISWLNKKYKSNVLKYYFRSKDISWRGNSCQVSLKDGEIIQNDKKINGFMNLYYSNIITRKCCYNCKYTTIDRVSDLTISDFWGIENVAKEFEDKLGVSMVMVNSKKGALLFDRAQGDRVACDLKGAKQPQLYNSQQLPKTRDEFWKDYEKKGIDYALKKYGGVKTTLKEKIYKILNGNKG